MTATVRLRRALWAIGLLAVATAATGALVYGQIAKSKGGAASLGSALPGFAVHAEDVTQYLITTPEGSYRLTKGDARWVLMERSGYPASIPQIQALAAGLVNLKLQRILTRDPQKFDALRLSDPRQGGTGTLIQASDAQNTERASLLIGHSADDLLLRYPGSDVAYIASGALPPLANPAAFADLDALHINAKRIQRVEITPASGTPLKLERAAPGDVFMLTPKQRGVPADLGQVGPSLDAIALSLIPFRPVDVSDETSAPAGEALGQRRITTFDGLSIQMNFSKHDDSIWASVAAGGGGSSSEAVAINSRTSGWVFAFPLSYVETLFPGAAPPSQKDDLVQASSKNAELEPAE